MVAKVVADENAAMQLGMAQLRAEAALKGKKPKTLDSGANISVISDITLVDTNTISLCPRADGASGVEFTDGTVMPIEDRRVIAGVEGAMCNGAS